MRKNKLEGREGMVSLIHFISFHFLNFFRSSNFLKTFTNFSLKDEEAELF